MMRMVDYPNIYYQQYMPDIACLYKCTKWSVCLSHLEGCVMLVQSGVDCTNEWYLGGVFVYIGSHSLLCLQELYQISANHRVNLIWLHRY